MLLQFVTLVAFEGTYSWSAPIIPLRGTPPLGKEATQSFVSLLLRVARIHTEQADLSVLSYTYVLSAAGKLEAQVHLLLSTGLSTQSP